MALDTREKRAAAVAVSHYFLGPNVTPNSLQDQEWRQEVGWGYPGILVSTAAIIVIEQGGGTGAGGQVGGYDIYRPPVYIVVKGTKRTAGGLGPRRKYYLEVLPVGGTEE